MHPNCVLEIAAALGRTPTAKELADVENGLLTTMRELARSEPKWQTMSADQRLQAAAATAQSAAIDHATKVAERRALNLVTQTREVTRMASRAAAIGGKVGHHKALFERFRQVDDYVAGVRNESLSSLVDAVHAVEPKFFGLLDNPESVRSFAKAVMDGATTDPKMTKAAKAYTDALEAMRLRANAAGADIGKLDYGYLPQPHDVGRIARAGIDKWAADVMPLLRRDRYVDATGAAMSDADVMELVRGAYVTLSTEGRNKRVPGAAGGGSRASRFDDAHRSIHFKDAESYLTYLGDYGRGSMMTSIHGHVGMLSKTIGMMEELGANPTSTYRLLKDTAEKADNAQGVHDAFATLDMVWDTLNGTTAQPVSSNLAQFFQGVRNFTTAAKLQGVMLSAISDVPMQIIVAKSSGVPIGAAMGSVFNGIGKNKRRLAEELALGMDEIAGELARWHQDNLAQGWTAKLAQATMRLTLVEGWTNGLRRGFALTMSGTLDRMRAKDWGKLDQGSRNRFESAGVTEADWKVWQMAKGTPMGATTLLTKDGIRGIPAAQLASAGLGEADVNRATARLLGYLDQEARTAVLSPDIRTRAMLQQGTKAGTPVGEGLRSLMLFKSFGFAIVDKHLRRIKNIPSNSGRAAYSIAMMSSLTLFGAITQQLKDISNGKDPRDMTTAKFWAAAFMQGGGFGIFGDVLYTGMGGNARGGQSNWTSLAGPVFGNVMDAANVARKGLGWVTADEAKEDKAGDQFKAEALRVARGNTPLINLWYLRAAVDHMFMHDLQEQLSPGYLRKMKKRSRKDWGQDYWYEPGDKLPDRAPNPEAALGKANA